MAALEEMIGESIAESKSLLNTSFLRNSKAFKRLVRRGLSDPARYSNGEPAAAVSDIAVASDIDLMALDFLVENVVREYDALGHVHNLKADDHIERLAKVRKLIRQETGMELYREQLLAVVAGLHGFNSQVNTGEGKTITAIAYALMHDKKVDVFTSNRTLAERDYRENRHIYEAAGKTVALNLPHSAIMEDFERVYDKVMPAAVDDEGLRKLLTDVNKGIGFEEELKLAERLDNVTRRAGKGKDVKDAVRDELDSAIHEHKKEAYNADVLYSTIDERIFDYEIDNSGRSPEMQVQANREFGVAVIDEADQNMVDDAINPKVLSGKTDKRSNYENMMLIDFHKYVITEEFRKREGEFYHGSALNAFDRSMPILRKGADYIADRVRETGILELICERYTLKYVAERFAAGEFKELVYLAIRQKSRDVRKGAGWGISRRKLKRIFGDEAEKGLKILDDISLFTNLIHKAHTEYVKDGRGTTDKAGYFIRDKEVKLVDQATGMESKGRKLQNGLHNALEVINGLYSVENEGITGLSRKSLSFASITNTHFFRKYSEMFWMSGTLEDVEFIAEENYRRPLFVVPPHYKKDERSGWKHVWGSINGYSDVNGKYDAILEDIVEKHNAGIPVLVRVAHEHEARELAFRLACCTAEDKDSFREKIIRFIEKRYEITDQDHATYGKHLAESLNEISEFRYSHDNFFVRETIKNAVKNDISEIKGAINGSHAGWYKRIQLRNRIRLMEGMSVKLEHGSYDSLNAEERSQYDRYKNMYQKILNNAIAENCFGQADIPANIRILTHANENEYEEIISNAGKKGAVTFVTDIGGRGADIKLEDEVKFAGLYERLLKKDDVTALEVGNEKLAKELSAYLSGKGLNLKVAVDHKLQNHQARVNGEAIDGALQGAYEILTTLSEDRRNDRQAIGRIGRNGDPGEVQAYLSAEDDVYGRIKGSWLSKLKIRFRNYTKAQGTNQGIFRNSKFSIDSIVDSAYEERQRILELGSVDEVFEYAKSSGSRLAGIINALNREKVTGLFGSKEEFNKFFSSWLEEAFTMALESKSILDANIQEMYHDKKPLWRKAFDYAYERAFAWFPVMNAGMAYNATGDANEAAKSYLFSLAWFGLPKLYQSLKNRGFNVNRPNGNPTSKREPNLPIRTAKALLENLYLVIPAAGAAVSAAYGTLDKFVESPGNMLGMGYFILARGLRKLDEKRIVGQYDDGMKKVFEQSLSVSLILGLQNYDAMRQQANAEKFK